MTNRVLNRRTFLRGAGVSIALPWLPARAASRPPRRFVVFGETNGYLRKTWMPTGTERDFALSPALTPLAPHKDQVVILDGIDNLVSRHSLGPPHMKAFGPMLTGAELQKGRFTPGGNGGTGAGYPGNLSVDQKIAERIGRSTRFRSLELGVQVDAQGNPETRMCYRAVGQPLPPENDPQAALDRLFAEGRGRQRKPILDTVLDDYRRLVARLGPEDRARLEAHLTALREVETRIGRAPQPSCQRPSPLDVSGEACTEPDQIAGRNGCTDDRYERIGRAQIDVMVLALACDLTRVASLQWSNCGNRIVFGSLGLTETHHDLEHQGAEEPLTKINTWYARQFAYLLQRLASVREADGTSLLDNTLVLWCFELGDGRRHSTLKMPFVLAGGAGGRLRTGRFLRFEGRAHNDVLVTCMNLMGVEGDHFGDQRYGKGALPGLT
jgi:hypothetical protein